MSETPIVSSMPHWLKRVRELRARVKCAGCDEPIPEWARDDKDSKYLICPSCGRVNPR